MKGAVVILGASSDIGLAVCRRYLAEGRHVVAHCCRGKERLRSLTADAGQLTTFVADFDDAKLLTATIRDMHHELEGCDVLIGAASRLRATPFAELTAEDLQEAFRINVLPGLLFMQAVAPGMVQRRFGRIVHLSSIGIRFRGGASSFAYALSKHAVEFLPRDIDAWATADVLVNVLRVGVTDTRIHGNTPGKTLADRARLIPMGRAASPDEMAAYVHFLGSPANSFMTGEIVTVAGGE